METECDETCQQTKLPEIIVNGDSVPEMTAIQVVRQPLLKGGGGFRSTGLSGGVVIIVTGLLILGAGVGIYMAIDRMTNKVPGKYK